MLIFATMLLAALIVIAITCIAVSPLFRTITRAIDSCAYSCEEGEPR